MEVNLETDANTVREYDIAIPTPEDVAKSLQECFSEDQAAAITEYVYRPLRDTLAAYCLKDRIHVHLALQPSSGSSLSKEQISEAISYFKEKWGVEDERSD